MEDYEVMRAIGKGKIQRCTGEMGKSRTIEAQLVVSFVDMCCLYKWQITSRNRISILQYHFRVEFPRSIESTIFPEVCPKFEGNRVQ